MLLALLNIFFFRRTGISNRFATCFTLRQSILFECHCCQKLSDACEQSLLWSWPRRRGTMLESLSVRHAPPDRGRLETIASHSACRRASVPVASVQQGLPDDRPDPSSPRRSAIRPKGKKHKVLSNGCFKQVFCQVGTIVAYHPPIFRPMKRLTQSDVKQDIVMKAIARGVGIYSPHTACDNCVDGGINVISDRHSSCADAWT